MGLKKHHHLSDRPVFDPGLTDHGQFFLGDSCNFRESFDLVFKYIQGVVSEVFYNLLGGLGPHAFNQAGSKVFFKRCGCGRFAFDRFYRFELASEFRMNGPCPLKLHCSAGKHFCLMDGDRFLLMGIVKRQNTQDRPSVVRIVVGNAIDDTANRFADGARALDLSSSHIGIDGSICCGKGIVSVPNKGITFHLSIGLSKI